MDLLRPVDSSDLSPLLSFGEEPAVWRALGLAGPPDESAWRSRLAAASGDVFHRFGSFSEGRLSAFGEIQCNMRARARHCAWLFLGASPPGSARPLLRHLLAFSDLWLGVARLECSLDAGDPLEALLQEEGFVRETLKPGHRDGPRRDVAIYSRLRPGWVPNPPTAAPIFPAADSRLIPHIRPMTPQDAAGIATGMSDERVAWGTLQLPSVTPDYWRPRLEKPSGCMFVAEVDGQVAGTAGFHPYAAPSAHATGMGMSIHAPWQGRGLAGPLLETVLSEAKKQGYQRMDLEVYADNERAVRLYRRFGFVKEGHKRHDVWRFGGHAGSDVMGQSLS